MKSKKSEGAMMRKLTFLLVACAVLVLAIASVAYATTNSGYANWTSQGPNAASLPTPHKDFQLTTNKCAVCHAVHKGTDGGQVLLRSTIANACAYCHITTNIGGVRLYAGLESNYTQDYATAHGGTTYSECVDCHSVHGAKTMTGAVAPKILKYNPGGNSFETTAVQQGLDATAGIRDVQVTLFCSACHPYYTRSYTTSGAIAEINIPATAGYSGFSAPGTYQSHIMTDSGGTLASYGGSPNFSGQVAWVESSHCRDCHDAGQINVPFGAGTTSDSFPHYTANQSRFLLGALYSGASTATPIGSGEDSAQADGACLKCHRGSTTTGVGFDY